MLYAMWADGHYKHARVEMTISPLRPPVQGLEVAIWLCNDALLLTREGARRAGEQLEAVLRSLELDDEGPLPEFTPQRELPS